MDSFSDRSTTYQSKQTRSTASTAPLKPLPLGISGGPGTRIPPQASNISVLVTNLRLLDLDLSPDWPGINAQTFSAKDATQGQKKRIQCTEWALYQLFSLWDPEEAKNVLSSGLAYLVATKICNLSVNT
jgi:hypothetical protein